MLAAVGRQIFYQKAGHNNIFLAKLLESKKWYPVFRDLVMLAAEHPLLSMTPSEILRTCPLRSVSTQLLSRTSRSAAPEGTSVPAKIRSRWRGSK